MTKNSIDALLSAAPNVTNDVEIGGVKITVKPLSLMMIAKLLRRFPDAMKLLTGGTDNDSDAMKTIVTCGPEAIAAVISAGTGALNDIENEQKIANLPDEWQAELLAEIVNITMPDGLDVFLEKFLPFLQKMGMLRGDSAAAQEA